MDGDLLGFATPPTAEPQNDGTITDSNAQPSAPVGFDLLSGSPVKASSATPASATEALEAKLHQKYSDNPEADTDVPAFAAPPLTETPSVEEAPPVQEPVNLLDFGGAAPGEAAQAPSTTSNNITNASVNLLDFGAAAPEQAPAMDLFASPPAVENNSAAATSNNHDPFNLKSSDPPTNSTVDLFSAVPVSNGVAVDLFSAPAAPSSTTTPMVDPFAVTPGPTLKDPVAENVPSTNVPTSPPASNPVDTSLPTAGSMDSTTFAQTPVLPITSKDPSPDDNPERKPESIKKLSGTQPPTESKQTPSKPVSQLPETTSAAPSKKAEPTKTADGTNGEKKSDISKESKGTESVAEESESAAPTTLPQPTAAKEKGDGSKESKATESTSKESQAPATKGPPQPAKAGPNGKSNGKSQAAITTTKDQQSSANKPNDALSIPTSSSEPKSLEGHPAKATPSSDSERSKAGPSGQSAIVSSATPPKSAKDTSPNTNHPKNDEAASQPAIPKGENDQTNESTKKAPQQEQNDKQGKKNVISTSNVADAAEPTKGSTDKAATKEKTPTNLASAKSTQAAVKETESKPSTKATAQPTEEVLALREALSKEQAALQEERAAKKTLADRLRLLEKEHHLAKLTVDQLQSKQTKENKERKKKDALLTELQTNLQKQMSQRAEAEDKSRRAVSTSIAANKKLEDLEKESREKIDQLNKDVKTLNEGKNSLQTRLASAEKERDDHVRRQAELASRINGMVKDNSDQKHGVEYYSDQVEHLKNECSTLKDEFSKASTERDQLKEETTRWKEYAEQRTKQLEKALAAEKNKNEERKRKLRELVEIKTEEVRSAKSDTLGLQTELDQCNITLKDMNQRYKQLHGQWIQTQTRNRELQRDISKMKKDSEKMSKVGGTLEAKLSRSAMETEGHKNKRLAAKNELMSVLGQLEAERQLNARLRDSVKNTFTPKALSQQQAVQDTIDDLESALIRLATKLGKPLPPPKNTNPAAGLLSSPQKDPENDKPASMSEAQTQKVLKKFEEESKRVSLYLMSLAGNVERLNSLVQTPTSRNCVGALQSFLAASAPPPEEGGTSSMSQTAANPKLAYSTRGALT